MARSITTAFKNAIKSSVVRPLLAVELEFDEIRCEEVVKASFISFSTIIFRFLPVINF